VLDCLAAMAMLLGLCTVWCAGQDAGEPPTIHLFYSPSCPHSHQVRALVDKLHAKHPRLSVKEYNITKPENIELMAEFSARYDVPEEQWGGSVAVFVGERWWTDGDKILKELAGAVDEMGRSAPADSESRALGVPGQSDATAAEVSSTVGGASEQGRDRLVGLFERFGVLAVAGAGLADGVNPCAFAALIFLLSYLSFTKRTGAQVLATGVLFAARVFSAYLGVGVALFRGLQALSGVAVVSKLLYPAMALDTLALTGYSLRD